MQPASSLIGSLYCSGWSLIISYQIVHPGQLAAVYRVVGAWAADWEINSLGHLERSKPLHAPAILSGTGTPSFRLISSWNWPSLQQKHHTCLIQPSEVSQQKTRSFLHRLSSSCMRILSRAYSASLSVVSVHSILQTLNPNFSYKIRKFCMAVCMPDYFNKIA